MDTPEVTVPGAVPPGGSTVVGPFAWHPQVVGHECMFMEVSAPGDRSNTDPATFLPCAAGPTPEWRLVPFDNNLAQRNVCPVAGGGDVRIADGRFAETVADALDGRGGTRVVGAEPRAAERR